MTASRRLHERRHARRARRHPVLRRTLLHALPVMLVLACLRVVLSLSNAGAVQATSAPAAPATTASRPASLPRLRDVPGAIPNIFVPPSSQPSSQAAALGPSVPARAFTVVGVVRGGRGDRALVRFDDGGSARWMTPGESLEGLRLARVEDDAVVLRVGGRDRALRVGQSSRALSAGRRTFAVDGTLVGVVSADAGGRALVQLEDATGPVRLEVGDAVPGGRVAEIREGSIVLEGPGGRRTVAVGQATRAD